MNAAPSVSVILTAHNRSNVMRLALDSALRQQFEDLEVLVYCDGCSDDSAAVAHASADPRVRVFELNPKLGHQARVTNLALTQARAPWIACLNQDDLWLPDHLQRLLDAATAMQAQVAVARQYSWTTQGPRLGPQGYSPLQHYPMSARLVHRDAFARLGALRDPTELYCLPSDEWLFRAWYRGERIAFSELPSLVKIDSVLQGCSYRERADQEQLQVHRWLQSADPRAHLEAAVLAGATPQPVVDRWRRRSFKEWAGSARFRLSALARRSLQQLGLRLGIAPQSVDHWWYGHQRGGFQRWINRMRGSD